MSDLSGTTPHSCFRIGPALIHPSCVLPCVSHDSVAGAFKVPSLRNVSKTAPYLHDGRFKTLDETVTFMWDAYKKKTDSKDTLSDGEKRDIVAFLRAL